MKRRHVVLGAAAAGVAAGWWARPSDAGGAHAPYFLALRSALSGLPAMPTLVVDRARLRANLASIRRIAHPKLPLRVVVKSLPSLGLVDEAMSAWGTRRAMLFNAPQLALMARERPDVEMLLGKPLPASAAKWMLEQPAGPGFSASRQIEWLVDTPERLADYRDLARARGQPCRLNIEIDVGLHRGGIEDEATLAQMLALIRSEPMLQFSGLMGYDAHLAAIPDIGRNRADAQAEAQRRYSAMREAAAHVMGGVDANWTLNAAGSPTFHLHDDQHAPNELSVGSAAVKPSDFDKPSLAGLAPAAFIATPVLKTMAHFRLPVGAQAISTLAGWWDVNQQRALAIHGGHWLADPVSPPGVSPSSLYGPSSNQQVMVASPTVNLRPGDWLFLRPRQSEAVFLQFGPIAVVDEGQLVGQWPVFPASA